MTLGKNVILFRRASDSTLLVKYKIAVEELCDVSKPSIITGCKVDFLFYDLYFAVSIL